MKTRFIIMIGVSAFALPAFAADPVYHDWNAFRGQAAPPVTAAVRLPTFKGPVTVLDGRTLWFGTLGNGHKVRLAGIDACELPQWALNAKWIDRDKQKALTPVPCGPLAKAWLKKTVGNRTTTCVGLSYANDGVPVAQCTTGRTDLAAEMLRVGWARLDSPYINAQYYAYQTNAMAARYGMWGTYVLDMNEWRRKAVDKTLDRHPIADFNLLAKRQAEISPPFADARAMPKRTDR
ncbi:thermonuclease family protein [Rhizobium sp. FKY42]|uniref:thermonuclease family protein n=1 Tax=Rhizobium sp. FKY42 TaxID=2562310 RepID=UPI0010C10DAF|nr:thermonuclease family protein [Rhizobium sp. FKY42]